MDHLGFTDIPLLVTLRNADDDTRYEVEIVLPHALNSGGAIASELVRICDLAIGKLIAEPNTAHLSDAVAKGEIVPETIRKPGETVKFSVRCDWPYGEGSTETDFEAVDEEDASLQAHFHMACTHLDMGFGPDKLALLENYVDYMTDCGTEIIPTTQQKSDAAFLALVVAVRDGGDIATALSEAEEVLRLRGMLDAPAPAPGVTK